MHRYPDEFAVMRMDNATLLQQTAECQDRIAKSSANDHDYTSMLQHNLALLLREQQERIRLGGLTVPAQAPQTSPAALQSRLFELKLTRATYGINTAPEIHIEIAAIEKALELPSSREW